MSEKIAVLAGGLSCEREISLISGKAVYEALSAKGLDVICVDPIGDFIPLLKKNAITIVFIALHGAFGEDGTVQMLLEEMQIPHTGSSPEASRYAMDKLFSRRRWLAARLPIPRWVEASSLNAAVRVKELSFPVMVKPISQGSSIGMSLVETQEELPAAVEEASRFGERFLLEEYLPGSEVTVGILQDRPLPVIQIVPKRRFYDYVAKYTPGMTEYLVPAPLPSTTSRRLQQLAKTAHQVLGCRSFSRVDMILTPGRGPVLLELNTIPGMTPLSLLPKAAACAGIHFPELCRRMLASALERKEECRQRTEQSSASASFPA